MFTRFGSFQSRPKPDGQVVLADADGNFLQGWPVNNNGGFNIGTRLGSLGPICVDPASAMFAPVATTRASPTGNDNAPGPTETSFTSTIGAVSSAGTTNNIDFTFTKNAALNTRTCLCLPLSVPSPRGPRQQWPLTHGCPHRSQHAFDQHYLDRPRRSRQHRFY